MDKDGVIRDARVKVELISQIAHGPLAHVDAIVVHETDSSTASGTLGAYRNGATKGNGAHFLIDKDGTIYQTVSIQKKCQHVGRLKSRCFETHSCSPKEESYYTSLKGHDRITGMNTKEQAKDYPKRYPSNLDSLGIEIVGKCVDDKAGIYEKPTPQEQQSLQWLVRELLDTLHLTRTDIYRHPQVSYKKDGEAKDAVW